MIYFILKCTHSSTCAFLKYRGKNNENVSSNHESTCTALQIRSNIEGIVHIEVNLFYEDLKS